MTTIIHTKDIPTRFDVAYKEACAEIGCKPLDLLGVMMSESGVRASATNGAPWHAVGLIQFMPDTLKWLGWRDGWEAFRRLDAVQQLPYVVRYFQAFEMHGKPWTSAGRLYQCTFLPGTLSTHDETEGRDTLVVNGDRTRLGWAYSANAVFDENRDGKITIAELTQAIFRNSRGPRYLELLGRLGLASACEGVDLDPDGDGRVDIVSCFHLQTALDRLGHSPGAIDGLFGPNTSKAIKAFETERELPVVGLPTASLRSALAIAVEAAR